MERKKIVKRRKRRDNCKFSQFKYKYSKQDSHYLITTSGDMATTRRRSVKSQTPGEDRT